MNPIILGCKAEMLLLQFLWTILLSCCLCLFVWISDTLFWATLQQHLTLQANRCPPSDPSHCANSRGVIWNLSFRSIIHPFLLLCTWSLLPYYSQQLQTNVSSFSFTQVDKLQPTTWHYCDTISACCVCVSIWKCLFKRTMGSVTCCAHCS